MQLNLACYEINILMNIVSSFVPNLYEPNNSHWLPQNYKKCNKVEVNGYRQLFGYQHIFFVFNRRQNLTQIWNKWRLE